MVGRHSLGAFGEWLFGKSDAMDGFIQSYASAPWAWQVVFLLVSTLGPGIGEELLFRGYLQHGLLKARGKPFAIVFTAIAFSLCHLPPARVLSVLPLAFWLGFLALRTGSLIPGVLCHIFVNLTSGLALAHWLDAGIVIAPAFILGLPALVIALLSLRRLSRVPPASAPLPPSGPAPSPNSPEIRSGS